MKTGMALIIAAAFAAALVGCAESLVATGYVTAGTGNEVTINTSRVNNIQPGDTLTAYANNGKRYFLSGEVRVLKVIGKGSAVAEVISGQVRPGDRVEKWVRS